MTEEDTITFLLRQVVELDRRITQLESDKRPSGLFKRGPGINSPEGQARLAEWSKPRWVDLGPYREPKDE